MGISYVSIANAKANVEAENPVSAFSTDDFDKAVASASDTWNSLLNKIQVSGGMTDDLQTFYSMLYHALIGPTVISDANGEYNTAYPGNDDAGEMSSWYVFAALGMYPELPGSDVLVLNSPLFSNAVIHLQTGDVTITGKGAGKDAPYVQSLTVNGQSSNKPWIRYADVSHGATLVYELGSAPNTTWGSDPADAPPSYTDGMSQTSTAP